jgi:hypothetical protein
MIKIKPLTGPTNKTSSRKAQDKHECTEGAKNKKEKLLCAVDDVGCRCCEVKESDAAKVKLVYDKRSVTVWAFGAKTLIQYLALCLHFTREAFDLCSLLFSYHGLE